MQQQEILNLMAMRLDKFLSEASAYSRKEIRGLVRAGLISVDGVPAKSPALGAMPQDSRRLAYKGDCDIDPNAVLPLPAP